MGAGRSRSQTFGGAEDGMFAYVGACEACSGRFFGADEINLDTVRSYTDSANYKGKREIINDLVDAGSMLIGKKLDDNMSPEEKVKILLNNFPSPDKISPGTHKAACDKLAGAINKAYGNEIIRPGQPAEVCRQVAEVLSSLTSGMHSEFLSVYNDIRNVVKNLHILKGAMKESHEKMVAEIRAANDDTVPIKLANIAEINDIILAEIDRQIHMLTNLLHVNLMPAEKDLAKLLADKKDLNGYIEKIEVGVGDRQFSRVLSDVLKGLGVTAALGQVINKALQTVGMTLDEYTRTNSVRELRDRIVRGLMDKKMDDKQRNEYLNAADILYKNLNRSAEFLKSGAADTIEDHHHTIIDDRVKDRRKIRNLIFDTFYRRLGDLYDSFIGSLDALTMQVGRQIPITDSLLTFRQYLQRLDVGLLQSKQIYYALIGYYNDALSKSKKDTIMADLRHLNDQLSVLEAEPNTSAKPYFSAVKSHIGAIIQLIDRFSDEIGAKFGRGETREGGADDDIESNDYLPEARPVYRTAKTIHDAIRQFDYRCREASIRSNLSSMSEELPHYGGKQYDSIVAESIADILTVEKEKYERLRNQLTDKQAYGENKDYVVSSADLGAAAPAGFSIEGFKEEKDVKAERDAAEAFLDAQWDAKKKLWATVEAVDAYMRVFTDALVKNPQDVKEIKSMLDEITTNSEWYSERTGNELTGVFEHFPSSINGDGLYNTDLAKQVVYPPKEYYEDSGDHPYKKIGDKAAVAASGAEVQPGNPYLVTLPTKGKDAFDQCKKMLGSLSILKNLLSVFIHVGSKFGGEELRKKVFMTPTQMYKNLVDYICASAFAQGFGTFEKGFKEHDLPNQFYTSDFMAVSINMKTGLVEQSSGVGSVSSGAAIPGDTYASIKDGIVRVGLITDYAKALTDAHYPANSIAKGLVAKINSAMGDLVLKNPNANTRDKHNAGDNESDPLNPPGKVEWKSGTKSPERALLFKKRWGVWMRSVLKGLQEQEGFNFEKEDKYFVLILKSLAAKVLTVTSMYNLFDRPLEYNGLSPIRMILGGDSTTPKIEEAAVPLYLRLPLLAQFYRNIFGFDEDNGEYNEENSFKRNNNVKISMVPDVDGVFSGLIRLVFRQNKFIKGSQYSDDDMKELIKEINLIYQRMVAKHPQNVVMGTIHEFVAEINRRYGIVTMKTRDAFNKEFDYRYDYANVDDKSRYTPMQNDNIAILPGEGDDDYPALSGAEKLLGDSLELSDDKKKHKFAVLYEHKDLLDKFRCAIDKYFDNSKDMEANSFVHAIKSVQAKLKIETNDENRFKLVAGLIRGGDLYNRVDSMKYIVFHETVVAGLNMLSAVHSILYRFKRRMMCIDIRMLEDRVWDYLDDTPNGNIQSLVKYIRTYINDKLLLGVPNDTEISNVIRNILGLNENAEWNGGSKPFVKGTADFTLKRRAGAASINRWDPASLAGGKGAPLTKPLGAATSLVSILEGYKVSDLKAAYHGKISDVKTKQAAETLMRFLFNREFIMKELIESVFGLAKDFQGLVDVRIEQGKILMSHNGIKTMVEDMFKQVGDFIDFLRPHIKYEIIEKYTDKKNAGSYYWLQEQLMEKIIIGRPAVGSHAQYHTLDQVMNKLSVTWEDLNREWTIDGRGLTAVSVSLTTADPKYKRDSFDKVFAEMVFYDAAKPQSGIVHSRDSYEAAAADFGATKGLKQVDFLHGQYDSLYLAGPPGQKTLDTRFAARFHQLYTWNDDEFTLNRSTMFDFNQLLAKFIQAFYDPVSSKIYSSVLSQFANGPFSRSIQDFNQTYPDTAPCVMIKYSGIGTSSPMTYQQVLSIIRESPNAAYLNNITDMLKQMTKYGEVGGKNTYDHRKNMLNFKNASMTTNYNYTPNKANTRPTSGLFIHMLANILGKMVHNANVRGNDALVTGKVPHPLDEYLAGISEWNLRPPYAPAGIAALIAGNPYAAVVKIPVAMTLDDIMNKLLSGKIADLISRLSLVFNFQSGVSDTDANAGNRRSAKIQLHRTVNSLMPGAVNAPAGIGAIANLYLLPPIADLEIPEYVNKILMYDVGIFDIPMVKFGIVPVEATRLFTLFQDDCLGQTATDTDVRLNLFAAICIAIGEISKKRASESENSDYNQPHVKANLLFVYNQQIDTIRSAATTVQKVATGSMVTPPRTIVKSDDLILGSNDITGSSIVASNESSYLILARSNGIPGYLNANSIDSGDLLLPGRRPVNPTDNDITNIVNFERRYDPDADHVLFTSLSIIIRNLVSSRTNSQAPVYMQDNVADVAPYMKEKMRANLPTFRNLFKELSARCEFIKMMLNQSEVNVMREYAVNKPIRNPWPYVLKEPTVGSDETKGRFTDILDTIIRGCATMISTCDQTLREIGDDPKYFELYQNSIKNYRDQNGFDPLMPLSSAMVVLQNTDASNAGFLLPTYGLGQPQFKFAYGLRSLLGQPSAAPSLEHVPGFNNVINMFNLTADSRLQITKDKAEGFLKAFTKMLRFVSELKNNKGLLTSYTFISNDDYVSPNQVAINNPVISNWYSSGLFTREDLIVTNKFRGVARSDPNSNNDFRSINKKIILTNKSDISLMVHEENGDLQHKNKIVYSLAHSPADSIKLTESSFRDDRIKDLVKYIIDAPQREDSMEVQNIIDLDIVPINVHALRREIPLINLYNYSYTFDRMIIELYYGLKNDSSRQLINDLCNKKFNDKIQSAKDMLVALLIDPYMNLGNEGVIMDDGTFVDNGKSTLQLELYNNHTRRMLSGAGSDDKLGRPKFLSDQIFNKAVFGKLYNTPEDYSEGSPAVMNYRKLTIDEGISIMGRICVTLFNNTTTGGRRAGALLSVDPKDKTVPLFRSVIKYVSDHPNDNVEKLTAVIQSIGARLDTLLKPGHNTDVDYKKLATLVAIIVKIVYYPIASLINEINKKENVDDTMITNAINIMKILVAALNQAPNNTPSVMGYGNDEDAAKVHLKTRAANNALWGNLTLNDKNAINNIIDSIIFKDDWIDITVSRDLFANVNILDGVKKIIGNMMATNQLYKTSPMLSDKNTLLTWMAKDKAEFVDLKDGILRSVFAAVGRLRFDTTLIRNLVFITNLYRSLRMKLQQDLNYSREIIMRAEPITRADLTEFYGNDINMRIVPDDVRNSPMWRKYDF